MNDARCEKAILDRQFCIRIFFIDYRVLDEGEFYKIFDSNNCNHAIICNNFIYKFRIRASLLKKKRLVITILVSHSCILPITRTSSFCFMLSERSSQSVPQRPFSAPLEILVQSPYQSCHKQHSLKCSHKSPSRDIQRIKSVGQLYMDIDFLGLPRHFEA